MNELINDGGVCRTAPATPGLLINFNLEEKWVKSTLQQHTVHTVKYTIARGTAVPPTL